MSHPINKMSDEELYEWRRSECEIYAKDAYREVPKKPLNMMTMTKEEMYGVKINDSTSKLVMDSDIGIEKYTTDELTRELCRRGYSVNLNLVSDKLSLDYDEEE